VKVEGFRLATALPKSRRSFQSLRDYLARRRPSQMRWKKGAALAYSLKASVELA
jgi:hypothetical protein